MTEQGNDGKHHPTGNGEVEVYLEKVAATLEKTLDNDLTAAFLGGSICMGDFDARRSDIDLVAVCSRPLGSDARRALILQLSHRVLPCPAKGLDLAVLQAKEVLHPRRAPAFEMGFATGATWEDQYDAGGVEQELLIDLELCRRHGRRLRGTDPAELVAPISRASLQAALIRVVTWHAAHIHHPFHDPLGHFAVLNACRARRLWEQNVFCSKTSAGRWMSAQADDPQLVQDALLIHHQKQAEALNGDRVRGFLSKVLHTMR